MDDFSRCRSVSSPLSSLSRSPTPPEQFSCSPAPRMTSKKFAPSYLPTPSSSQSPDSSELSSVGACTPRSDLDHSIALSIESDSAPPAKRRRLSKDSPPSTRETRSLDFNNVVERALDGSPPDADSDALDRLMKSLKNKRKIVVVAGAGISVSAGIPDFRSRTGLFQTLKETHNLKGSGKQLFDASVYRDAEATSNFHSMVRSMSEMSKQATPTPFHHLVARLAHEGRLLRLYSQNVDGLETSIEPLRTEIPLPPKGPWPKTIQLHGGLEKMVCTKCNHISDFQPDLFDSAFPPACNVCTVQDEIRTIHAGKRSHGVGRMRPRMVLYNEHNPDDEAIGSVAKADIRTRPDAVLVVGTSCKVPGVRRIVREMCQIVRDRRDGLTVWINRDPVPSGKDLEGCWDLIVKGNADDVAERAGLGRWDSPEVDIEIVDDETANAAKNERTVKVMVQQPPSPAKDRKQVKKSAKSAPGQKKRPVGRPKKPTNKGQRLEKFFTGAREVGKTSDASAATAPAPTKRRPGRPKKADAVKTGLTISLSRTAPKGANIKAQFKTSKTAIAEGKAGKNASESNQGPFDANGRPMEGVQDCDPRLNSAPASPADLKKPSLGLETQDRFHSESIPPGQPKVDC